MAGLYGQPLLTLEHIRTMTTETTTHRYQINEEDNVLRKEFFVQHSEEKTKDEWAEYLFIGVYTLEKWAAEAGVRFKPYGKMSVSLEEKDFIIERYDKYTNREILAQFKEKFGHELQSLHLFRLASDLGLTKPKYLKEVGRRKVNVIKSKEPQICDKTPEIKPKKPTVRGLLEKMGYIFDKESRMAYYPAKRNLSLEEKFTDRIFMPMECRTIR